MRFAATLTWTVAAAVVLTGATSARADGIVWTAGGPGSFDDANNWTSLGGAGHVVPGSNDFVSYIAGRSGSPAFTDVPGTFNVKGLFVSGINTGLGLHGGTSGIGTSLLVEGSPGGGAPLYLSVSGPGTVNVGSFANIGVENGADSSLLVGGGATLSAPKVTIGGESTKGTVAADGGTLNAGGIVVGANSPLGILETRSGAINVTGGAGLVAGTFGGSGTIAVNAGGRLTLTGGALTIGTSGGTGILAAQGASLFPFPGTFPATIDATTRDVTAGSASGNGTVFLQGFSSLATSGTVTIGTTAGTGIAALGGSPFPGGTATMSSGQLAIGTQNGTGTVSLGNFSQVNASGIVVGSSGGTGTLATSGVAGGVNVSGDLDIGYNGGTGTVALTSGNTLNVGGGIAVGDGTTGSTGTLSVASATANTGVLLVGGFGNTGTVVVSGTGSIVSANAADIGFFGGTGTVALKDNASLIVNQTAGTVVSVGGLSGNGTLSLTDKAILSSRGTVEIGAALGTGTAFIRDSSVVIAPNVTVGDNGGGTVAILGGGLVGGSSNLLVGGALTIGAHGGVGTVRAYDAARANVGAVSVGADKGSTGTLSVESDTKFTGFGALTVGSDVAGGGSGTVSVDYATLTAGSAAIGRGGSAGILFIKDHGVFKSSAAVSVGTNGLLDVTDAGSVAAVGGALTVSGAVPVANANLAAVQNGAELDSHGISVGNGGTGTVFIDGATSKVVNTGAVTIGGAGGTGVLSLSNHASLTSSGTVNVLPGGTLIGTGDVHGSVVNSGGTVVPGGSPGLLTVGGDFTQTAAGTLLFELFGTDPSEYDRLAIGGNAKVAGVLALDFTFSPIPGTQFDLITIGGSADFTGLTIEAFGAFTGPFGGRVEDGEFVVSVLPEPSPWMLAAAALALGVASRRANVHGAAGACRT